MFGIFLVWLILLPAGEKSFCHNIFFMLFKIGLIITKGYYLVSDQLEIFCVTLELPNVWENKFDDNNIWELRERTQQMIRASLLSLSLSLVFGKNEGEI